MAIDPGSFKWRFTRKQRVMGVKALTRITGRKKAVDVFYGRFGRKRVK